MVKRITVCCDCVCDGNGVGDVVMVLMMGVCDGNGVRDVVMVLMMGVCDGNGVRDDVMMQGES